MGIFDSWFTRSNTANHREQEATNTSKYLPPAATTAVVFLLSFARDSLVTNAPNNTTETESQKVFRSWMIAKQFLLPPLLWAAYRFGYEQGYDDGFNNRARNPHDDDHPNHDIPETAALGVVGYIS